MTNKITHESPRRAPLPRMSIVLPAICFSIASAACIDPPGGDAETQSALSAQTTAPPEITSRAITSGPAVTATLAAVRSAPSQGPVAADLTTGGIIVTARPGCYGPFFLNAAGSGLWVSAELAYTGGGTGMLRARANQAGPWEQYQLCFDGIDWQIYSQANGLWVSTELDYGGSGYAMLRARALSRGPWEHYVLINNDNDGTYSIMCAANARLVAAEFGYPGDQNGMLRARTGGTVGAWERFLLR